MNKKKVLHFCLWQAIFIVFLVAASIRLLTINKMGKTWDEGAYVEPGYKFIQLLINHDFNNPFLYMQSDHPPLAKYVYGFVSRFEAKTDLNNEIVFGYNYFWPRIVSVLLGSLTAVFIVIIGFRFFSPYIGFVSGLIFSLTPFFIGLSQLATLESFILFFFTICVYFYMEFLVATNRRNLLFTGITLGLALLVKQSNIILVPLLLIISFVFLFFKKNTSLKTFISMNFVSLLYIGIIAFITFFLLWPMPFFHLQELWAVQNTMWIQNVKLPPPEVFFGRLMLVPFPYYFVMFTITTPLVLLLLSFVGMLKIDKKKSFAGIVILIWFLFPFLQSFYAFKQHGVRYIIEIYAPFALLCGIGLSYINNWFKKVGYFKYVSLGFVVLYLLLILYKITPYYLDYFNEVVGGNNNVYQKQLFQMGWWGQGIGEAAFYISRNENRIVTVAVDGGQPASVMPKLDNIKIVYYKEYKKPDYIIVPYFNVVRLWFPEQELQGKYRVVYRVKVDNADLVKVYKRN